MSPRKIPVQLWLLGLLVSWFYLPLSAIFPPDNAFLLQIFGSEKYIWLAKNLLIQWALVIACYILSRTRCCAAIILIEVFCMAYNIAACCAPVALRDTIYDVRPLVVLVAFILQLLAIAISTGGGVGSHNNYNRRKSDTANHSDSDFNRAQLIPSSSGLLEAAK